MTSSSLVVSAEVCTGWSTPDAPRDLDAPAIADIPDIPAWLTALDGAGPDGRLDLHGRTLTQLVAGEPVEVVAEAGDWRRVVAPWQPSALDPRGYPAWVRRSHLEPGEGPPTPESSGVPADRVAITEAARRHLGLPYLWAGTTPYGFDCSGLVHHCYREAGVVVPRDAHDQWAAAQAVPLGEEQPGDLYFFARDNGYVYHVGFVTGEHRMLHAPESGRGIEEASLSPDRVSALLAAGRFLS